MYKRPEAISVIFITSRSHESFSYGFTGLYITMIIFGQK